MSAAKAGAFEEGEAERQRRGVSAARLTAPLTLRVSVRLSGNNRTQQTGRLIKNRNVLLTILGAGSPRLGRQGGQGTTLRQDEAGTTQARGHLVGRQGDVQGIELGFLRHASLGFMRVEHLLWRGIQAAAHRYVYACMLSPLGRVQLCDPMDRSPPGCSVHGILQARIAERVAMPSSRGSSPPRDRTHVSCIGRRVLYHCATWKFCLSQIHVF